MTCDKFADLFDLYALGLLESNDLEELRLHTAAGCKACAEETGRALIAIALVAGLVPILTPPAHLKDRIVATVSAGSRATRTP